MRQEQFEAYFWGVVLVICGLGTLVANPIIGLVILFLAGMNFKNGRER
jgi:hypothetical protein